MITNKIDESFQFYLKRGMYNAMLSLFYVLFQEQLKAMNDKNWENLYWNSEVTRPDRLAKVLNRIIRKESGDSKRFLYDRQAAKDAMIDMNPQNTNQFNSSEHNPDQVFLKLHDQRRLDELDKRLDLHSHSPSSSDSEKFDDNEAKVKIKIDKDAEKQHPLSQQDVTTALNDLFNNVQLEGDIITPRPINIRIVKFSKLNTSMKLSSNIVKVRTISNVHALPLRCSPHEFHGNSNAIFMARVDRMETLLLNLSKEVSMNKIKSLRNLLFTNVTNHF